MTGEEIARIVYEGLDILKIPVSKFEEWVKEDNSLALMRREVRARYRRAARTLHPDIPGTGDTEKFQTLNAMWDLLEGARFEPTPPPPPEPAPQPVYIHIHWAGNPLYTHGFGPGFTTTAASTSWTVDW